VNDSFVLEIYDFKLDVARKILLENKCVCDIGEKGGDYGNRMYSYYCNGKWLIDFHVSCWCLVLLRVWKEKRE